MPIAPDLQHFVDAELARAPQLIAQITVATLNRLKDARTAPASVPDRARQTQLALALQQHAAAYQARFAQALRDGVHEVLAELFEGLPSQGLDTESGLQLMDESRVEIDIAISRAMQRIDTAAEWELRELQTFTSALIGQSHVSTESNPLRPLVYATALWHAAGDVVREQALQTSLLGASAEAAAPLLKQAWAGACSRLEAQGLTPSVYRTVVGVAGNALGRAAPATSASAALTHLLASMPAGSPGMQVSVEHAAIAMGTRAQPSESRPRSPAFEATLTGLDAHLDQLPTAARAPHDVSHTLVKQLAPQRAALVAHTTAPVERQLIELVARLFDALLNDAGTPGPLQWVLARLQTSALRVALADHTLAQSAEHPVWQLVDRICECAIAYPQPNDPRAAALAAFCQTLARDLAEAPAPDATLYRRARAQFDAFAGGQFDAQLKQAQAAIASLQRALRRDGLERALRQRVHEQMGRMRPSATVRRFLTESWTQVVAESMLGSGEDSEATRGYIAAVDEVLWSVNLPNHPKSRARLMALLPGLLQRLRAGMALIGMPGTGQDEVLGELMAIHAEALRGGTAEPKLSAQEIVQRMRDEVLPQPSAHGGFSDSVIDLADMQTVPAAMMPAEPSAADEALRRVQALQPADRARLFLNGRWSRVQLLWRSEPRLFYLFAGETAAQTHSVTHRALHRLSEVGLLQPAQDTSAVQRALDKVTQDLARSA